MTKTTYKVGDKVRMVNGRGFVKKGTVTTVKSLDTTFSGEDAVYLDALNYAGHPTWLRTEFIEKVEESDAKMTQFKVGDKVEVTKGHFHFHIGDSFVIDRIDRVGDLFSGDGICVKPHKVKIVSPKPTKNQRLTSAEQAISTLEQKVEAMQAEIDALKVAQKPPVTVIADAIKRYKECTPNEQRKAIIDEAKAFVEKYSGIVKYDTTPYTTESGDTTVKLFVNKEKRIVTAIPHLVHANYTCHDDKKFAKCAPGDVFNEHIGKAIALGRALGLDVERFEKAGQPSEVVVGQVVRGTGNGFYSADKTFTINGERRTYDAFYYEEARKYGGGDNDWIRRNQIGVILDDTEAQY